MQVNRNIWCSLPSTSPLHQLTQSWTIQHRHHCRLLRHRPLRCHRRPTASFVQLGFHKMWTSLISSHIRCQSWLPPIHSPTLSSSPMVTVKNNAITRLRTSDPVKSSPINCNSIANCNLWWNILPPGTTPHRHHPLLLRRRLILCLPTAYRHRSSTDVLGIDLSK